MKTTKYILSIFIITFLWFGCKDEYDRKAEGDISVIAPEINEIPKQLIAYSELEKDNEFLFRLSWSKARFTHSNGMPASISEANYNVELAILGNLFAKSVKLNTTSDLFYDVNSNDFSNAIIELLGNEPEDDVYTEIRIVAKGGEYKSDSEPVTITIQYGESTGTGSDEIEIAFKQTNGNWQDFAVYAWGDAEVYGGWPGLTLTANDDGWYSFVVPTNRPINLILNSGDEQIDFISDPIESACYEFDVALSEFTKVDCPAFPKILRWKYVGDDWTELAVYAWGGSPESDTFGGWPGYTATPDEDGWCEVVIPAGQEAGNIIFNNGSDGQFDADIFIDSDICVEITSSSYEIVDCK